MKNIIKKITLVLMIVALLSGCVPAEYKEGVKIDRGYPDKELPIYDDAIVYFCEEDSDEITLRAGSEDDVEDVIDFYQELFEDEDAFILLDEKVKDDKYFAEGIIIGEELTFEIEITQAKGDIEEKVFESQFEIIISPQEEEEIIEETVTETQSQEMDAMDADIVGGFPIDVFSKYPGSVITKSNSDETGTYIIMFTTDDIAKVTDFYEGFLADADITSESTADSVTIWLGKMKGYSFMISLTDDPEDLEEGYNTGIGIGIMNEEALDYTQTDNGDNSVNGDTKEYEAFINQTVEQGGVKFTINSVTLYDNYEEKYGDITDGVMLDVTIENTNKGQTLSVSPSYGNIILNTGEILQSDYWSSSDNIDGDIIGEVIKNGVIYFPLNVTNTSEINGFTWVVNAPTDKDYNSVGSDFVFSVEFDNPNYQQLTREVNMERVYGKLNDLFFDNVNFTEIYEIPDAVYQTGPVTLHLPYVALVSQYEDYNGNVNDYIVIGAMVEAEEGAPDFSFYLPGSTLVTNTKEQLESDYTFSESLESSLSGGTYTYGLFCYKLESATIDQITGFDLYTDQPYDSESWGYIGEELVIKITLS